MGLFGSKKAEEVSLPSRPLPPAARQPAASQEVGAPKLQIVGTESPAKLPAPAGESGLIGFSDLPEILGVLTHGEKCLFSVEKIKLLDASSAADAICVIDVGLSRVWILQDVQRRQLLGDVEAGIKGRLTQAGKTVVKTAYCTAATINHIVGDWLAKAKSDVDVSRSPGLANFKQWLMIAMKERAGDLHLSVRGAKGMVQLRIDTEIMPLPGPEKGVFPRSAVEAAIADSYGLLRASKSGQATDFHKDRGAYAMLPSEKLSLPLRVRYQYIANIHGGNAALRLLPEGAELAVKSLEDAGYAVKGHIDEMTEACRAMSASLTLAGVTGSGKTTAQALIFRTIIDPTKCNVYEFGDPIEILNEAIYQVSASRDVADTDDKEDFARFSAETMRGDPDVICVGETRDMASCALFEKAALSGHLALTTIHAKGIEGIPQRYAQKDIGLARDKMGSSALFGALAYISLEPRLCPTCKIPATDFLKEAPKTEEETYCRELTLAARDKCNLEPERLYYRRIGGCEACKGRGTKGVTNLAEVFRPNAQWRKLTREAKDEEAFEVFRQESDEKLLSEDFHGKPAFVHGLYKAAQGLIDLRSLRAYGDILRYSLKEKA